MYDKYGRKLRKLLIFWYFENELMDTILFYFKIME